MATKNNNARKGTCTNFGECSIADSKPAKVVELSILEDFECPECHKELSEIKVKDPIGMSKVAKLAIVALLVVGGGGAAYYFLHNPTIEKVDDIETVITPENLPVEEKIPEELKAESVGETEALPATAGNSGTLSLSFGTYVGDIKNGKANGQGKMTYKQRTLISKHDKQQRYAEAGQYIIGTWYGGELDFGKLYDSNDAVIDTLTIGRAE